MPDFTFDTPEPVQLSVRIPTGTVTVTTADTATSTVQVTAIDDEARELAEETMVRLDGRTLTIEVPERRLRLGLRRRRLAVRVTVPTGSALHSKVASADLTATGRFAEATVNAASGEVALDQVDGAVEVHCASGDISVGSAGTIGIHTASGDVRISHASGDVDVHCASGKVRIGVAERSVRVNTASGDISIDEARTGTMSLTAASGDLRVGVRAGVTAKLDLRSVSGRIRSELPVDDTAPADGAPLEIVAKSTSGNVVVVRAGT